MPGFQQDVSIVLNSESLWSLSRRSNMADLHEPCYEPPKTLVNITCQRCFRGTNKGVLSHDFDRMSALHWSFIDNHPFLGKQTWALSTIIAVSLSALILEVLLATLISPDELGSFKLGFRANVRYVLESQDHHLLCFSDASAFVWDIS